MLWLRQGKLISDHKLFGIIIMNANLFKFKKLLDFTKKLLKSQNLNYYTYVMSKFIRQDL